MISYLDYIQKNPNQVNNGNFIQGPQGPPGAKGEIGNTGPTAPETYTQLPILSEATFYLVDTNTVEALKIKDIQVVYQNNIPFNKQGAVLGTDIKLVEVVISPTNKTNQIILVTPGTYHVTYQLSMSTNANVQLILNDIPVPGTFIGRRLISNNIINILEAGLNYNKPPPNQDQPIFSQSYIDYIKQQGLSTGLELFTFTTLIETTAENSVLAIKNVTSDASTLNLKIYKTTLQQIFANIKISKLYTE